MTRGLGWVLFVVVLVGVEYGSWFAIGGFGPAFIDCSSDVLFSWAVGMGSLRRVCC